ncbi:nucleoside triphosphate pyrophosphohydrolase [Streptomyces sp. NPDC049954]|uniref:nucleoside triphosphate pyrophosphohydrolase n=1 Tax=Streptomyces sp. NPDC049954 TaxID=3155779 RepID=UPI003414B1F0
MNATTPAAGPGRIVLLTTSHRVAPGLLSWPAWDTLRTAARVLCADPDHPQLPYLREAGIGVERYAPEARELVEFCADGSTVVVLPGGPGGESDTAGDRRLTDQLAAMAGSGRFAMPELELLPASYDLPGARLLDLVQVMDRIRADCPWSSLQTHEGLAPYALEEVFELVEAIETGDRAELREELGDVLLQVVFHSRIAEEDAEEPFSVDDVAGAIVDKLVHRHPHVFGEESAETPEDVRALWLRRKAEEKGRTSVTEGVPLGQPALSLAAKLHARARTAALDVDLPTGPVPVPGDEGAGGGIGYELLALAAKAQAQGVDPETALRGAARAYRDAILAAESRQG